MLNKENGEFQHLFIILRICSLLMTFHSEDHGVIPQLEAAKDCHCDPAFRGTGGLAMTNLDPRN